MTVNIDMLIRGLRKSYPVLIDYGVIIYKTESKDSVGSTDLNLDMAKEGLFLSFRREGKVFNEMILYIQHDKVKKLGLP